MADDEIEPGLVDELLRWQRGRGPGPDVPADHAALADLLAAIGDSRDVADPPIDEDPVAVRLGLVEPPAPLPRPLGPDGDALLVSLHELARRLGGELDVEPVTPADPAPGGRLRGPNAELTVRAVGRTLAERVLVVSVDGESGPSGRGSGESGPSGRGSGEGDDLTGALAPAASLFARWPATTAVVLVSARTHLAVVVTEADCLTAIDPRSGWAGPALPRPPEPFSIALGRHLERTRPRWDEIAHLDDMLVLAPDPDDIAATVGGIIAEGLGRSVRIPARRTALASLDGLTTDGVVSVIDGVRAGRLSGDDLLDRIRVLAGVAP